VPLFGGVHAEEVGEKIIIPCEEVNWGLVMGYRFFYTFDVPPGKEGAFKEYMDELGARVMAKYCKNWRLFKLHTPLRGKPPMYIGVFEVEDVESFLGAEPPEEMTQAIERAQKVCANISEWIAEPVASSVR